MKKELVDESLRYVESGMTVGLGTGSTAYYFCRRNRSPREEEGLEIVGVTTSIYLTKKQSSAWNSVGG